MWFLFWKLHILTELRLVGICPSKVRACHCNKISWAANNTTITSMEIWDRILVIVAFVEVRVGMHGCKVRTGNPEIVSAQNFLGVVGLGQIRSTFATVHVVCHLSEVMLQSPLIGALKNV